MRGDHMGWVLTPELNDFRNYVCLNKTARIRTVLDQGRHLRADFPDAPFHSALQPVWIRTPPSGAARPTLLPVLLSSGHLLTCYQDLAFVVEDQRRWEIFPPPVCRLSLGQIISSQLFKRFFPHGPLGPDLALVPGYKR